MTLEDGSSDDSEDEAPPKKVAAPAKATLKEIIILQEFLKHQKAANDSPSPEDTYLLFSRKDFKLIACSVPEMSSSKVD
jgi:hypothetical protein